MCARAAEVKSLQRCSILRPANQWPEREELVDRLFTVVNVSAAKSVRFFEVARRYHLASDDQIAQSRSILLQLRDHVVCKLFPAHGPIAFLQLVRRKLHVNRH